jgi:amidase
LPASEPFAEYEEHDAVGLAGLVAAGEVTAIELVEAAIERVEALNPSLNAVILKQYDEARRLAKQQPPNAPLFGVPFLVKDLAMVAGDLATFGCSLFRDYRPDVTDEYIERVLRAGLIPIGRTNSPEFGLLPTTEPELHGPTHNPWDLDRSPGGSSGGAAAATAARIVPMAHASDGGGSIRIPASACGVFGLKPSRGRMPRYPGSAADYLSVDLAVSRSVRDVATLLDATHGATPGDAYQAPSPDQPFVAALDATPRPLRIAAGTRDHRGALTAPECIAAVEHTVTALDDLGHTVVEDRPGVDGQSLAEAFLVVWESLAEAIFIAVLDEAEQRRGGKPLRRILGDWRMMKLISFLDKRKSGRSGFETFTWKLADLSRRRSAGKLEAAKAELQREAHIVGRFLEEYDMVLSPVLGSPPPRLGEIDQTVDWDSIVEQLFAYVAFTPVANFSGLPAMSVPTYWTDDDIPIGAHFTSRFGDEAGLLSLAHQLEEALPWSQRRPEVLSGS